MAHQSVLGKTTTYDGSGDGTVMGLNILKYIEYACCMSLRLTTLTCTFSGSMFTMFSYPNLGDVGRFWAMSEAFKKWRRLGSLL